jgi:adenylate cyclase
VAGKIALAMEDLGEQTLKNIARPVRVYATKAADQPSGSTPTRSPDRPALPLPDKLSIAVLPFQNMSGDPEQEYFADGIVEDITTALSRFRQLFVIARNSSFTYKGKAVDVKQVGRELGVRYVLEGSVRKSGSRLRVTAQLIDTTSGNHIWAERYDRTATDLFDVQDAITESITSCIEPHLYVAESARAQRIAPCDLTAWEYVMRAMPHFWRHTASDFEQALDLLQRARIIDPSYGQAHSLWAWLTMWNAAQGWGGTPEASRPACLQAAETALALDLNDPWAYFAVGTVYFCSRNSRDARLMFERTLQINPNFALAHSFLGGALAYLGTTDEAIEEIELAMRLSPRDPFMVTFEVAHAIADFIAGRYQASAAWARKAAHTNPGYSVAQRFLAASAGLAGLEDEAHEALAKVQLLQPQLNAQWVEQMSLFTRGDDRARFIEGLRLAGLPE